MEKVLTIDLDCFFETDTYVNYKEGGFEDDLEKQWNVLEAGEVGNQEPNLKMVEWVKCLLELNTKADLVEIADHHEIIDVLKERNVVAEYLVNIDDHHDVAYDLEYRALDIGNWVIKAKAEGFFQKYVWIKKTTSAPCRFNHFDYDQYDWQDVDPEKLLDFDLIVICDSKDFVPRKYWEKIRDMLGMN